MSKARPIIDWQGRRIIAIPTTLLIVLAALTAYLALHERDAFVQGRSLVTHSRDVIEAAQSLLSEVQGAEAAERGYLITHDEAELTPYRRAVAALPAAGARLRVLVADNPGQSARAEVIDRIARARIGQLADAIGLARQGKDEQARASLASRADAAAMESLRGAVVDFVAHERGLLAARQGGDQQIRGRTFWIVMLASLSSMAGLAYALSAMVRGSRLLERRITERDQAEMARRESDALYHAIFANAADYLFVIDILPGDRFVLADVNPALEAAGGIVAADVRGQPLGQALPPDEVALFHQHFREIVAVGRAMTYQDELVVAEGRSIWETTFAPVYDEGRVVRIVGCGRDVTERARAEEQVRRAQRMEAIGQLTGGVAHDFNNLLQVIRANLEMVAPRIAGDEASSARLKSALRGADRAAQLTRQLLAFARRQTLEPRVVNLGRLITDMSDLLRRSMGETIAIATLVEEGLWNTLVDPAQVESAVLNLALNARDAMPEGGRLTLELTNTVLGEVEAAAFEDVPPGDYVVLTMTDTGAGMAPEVLSRVFEPFFTTKSEEKGTGLGLSMVYGFVKQSRGHVQVISAPGQGATVKIHLPRSRRAEERQVEAEPVARAPAQTVLVVEDDQAVRAAACAMLEDLGYRWLDAPDGESALKLLEGGADIQLLFTDVVMPGPIKGAELVARARTLRPDLPVLFTSGYAEDTLERQGRLERDVQLLPKPYGKAELAAKMRSAMLQVRPVVLVVEDDPLVRLSALDMVEDLGFAAVEAAGAVEALALVRLDGRIDVLFTDVGLPDMKGQELAAKAVAARPTLKVVFASGYPDDGSAPEGTVWLSKPYEQRELARALRGVIAGPSRRPPRSRRAGALPTA